MASTKRSRRFAEATPVPAVDAEPTPVTRRGKRRALLSAVKTESAANDSDIPSLQSMMPVLQFLAAPAVLIVLIVLSGGHWPKPVLFGIAGILGMWLAWSALRGPELIVACTLFYLPFSTTYAVGIAPGVNATNLLLIMGLGAVFLQAMSRRQKLFVWLPGTTLVFVFGFYTALSGITTAASPGGLQYLLYNELLNYKAWLDQFVFFFVLLCTIRDKDIAKRMYVYMIIGAMVLAVYAVPEMLDKAGRSSIEKSRLEGPHQQTNNFGGFVAYTLIPIAAVFIVYIKDWRAWLLTPSMLLAVKLLLGTFSRGAYLAMAFGGLIASYFRGKGFLAFWATMGVVFLLVFPQFIPGAIKDRMASLVHAGNSTSVPVEEKLDKSSQHRLILWEAAGKMIAEDPVFGKGYKMFQRLKAQYTEFPVHESDPHSMYLFIASQMGLPSLFMFIAIMLVVFHYGRKAARQRNDKFVRAMGIGAAGASACYGVICVFGSRAVNLEFTSYFWTLYVIMMVLNADESLKIRPRRGARPEAVQKVGAENTLPVPVDAEETPAGRRRRRRDKRASGGKRERQHAFKTLKNRQNSSY